MAYYAQSPAQVIIPSPQPRILVASASSPAPASTIVINHGSSRRSGRSYSRSRSRSRSRTIKHKHTHNHTFNLRGKNRRSKTRKSSKRVKMSIGEEHSSNKTSQRMRDLTATGTPVEVFLHANADHYTELPQNLRLQWAMAASFKNKESFGLSLRENDEDVLSSTATFNRQVTERTIDVEYKKFGSKDVRLSMNGKLELIFNNDDSLRFIVAVVPPESGNPWTSVRLNLYDDIYHQTHVKKQLPTVYVTIKFKKSSLSMTSYVISSVCVTVDFIPDRETVVTHTPHIDVLPGLYLESLDIVRWGSDSYTKPLHASIGEELGDRFTKAAHDQQSHWQLISNDEGKGYGSTTSRKHNVLWGEISNALLTRALVHYLNDNGNIDDLDNEQYLVDQLSSTKNGYALVSLVRRLYTNLHTDRSNIDHQDFPTLRQVLQRTTGLPSNIPFEYSDILDYYKTVTSNFDNDDSVDTDTASSSSDAGSVDSNSEFKYTDLAIEDILNHLKKFETANSDPDVIVEEQGNIFEALILFMYFRVSMQRTPLDVINQVAQDNSINLKWGLDTATDANDPLSLLSCAQSSLDDLVKFVQMIYTDLGRQDSLSAQTLLDPIYLKIGEPVAKTIGWYVCRTENNIDIIFSSQGKRSMLDATLVYFIPELRAWGVINEYTRDFDKALCFDTKCLVDILVKTVESLGDEITDNRPRHAIEFLPNTTYAHKYKVSEPIDRHLELLGNTYRHPFIDSVTGKHAQVSVRRNEESGNFMITSTEGVRPLEIGYSGEGDVFFKIESPYKNGDTIIITPEYVNIGHIFFISEAKVIELLKMYKSALLSAQKRISMDIHAQSHEHKIAGIKSHSMIASQFFEEPVGRRFFGGGGGRYGWGRGRPYYHRPYGLGYGLGTAAVLGTAAALGANAVYPPPYYYPYPPYSAY